MNQEIYVENVYLDAVDLQANLQLLKRWLQSPHVVRWWGDSNLYLNELEQRSSDTHSLITVDGRPIGYMCWQNPSYSELEAAGLTDLPDQLVDIDIIIGEPEFLHRGIGPRAIALLLTKLRGEGVEFAGLGTSISNHVAIKAFYKAGFRLFRDFDDPEFGPSKYMVVQLNETVEQGH